MRPLILAMSAFGPYAEPETVDFTLMEGRNFFLIHGPTGAGKSSVLDAMCFALYGETTGGEKDVKTIRSDFAEGHEPTEVTFDFRLGGDTYRVYRSPEQDRPKKRGGGTTRQPASATLWKLTGDRTAVLADRWGRVTDEVVKLMGFDVLQFRQVVVLPQGQFRKFLLSGSADRQKILEILFQTGIYRNIEEALKESARGIRTDYETLKQKRALLLEQETAEDHPAMEAQAEKLAMESGLLADALSALRTEESAARSRLDAAKTIQAKLSEHREATENLTRLSAREPIVLELEGRLHIARNAAGLKDAEHHLELRRIEMKTAETDVREKTIRFEKTENDLSTALQRRDRETEKAEEHPGIQRRIDTLKGVQSRLADLESAGRDLRSAQTRRAALQTETESLKKALESLAAERETKQALYKIRQQASMEAGHLALVREALQRDHDRLTEWASILEQKNDADRAMAGRQKEILLCSGTLAEKKASCDRAMDLFHASQAAVLARQLVPGTPCPVCGSPHHPSPAESHGEIPDESALKALKRETDLLEKRLKDMEAELTPLNSRQMNLESRIAFLAAELTDASGGLGPGSSRPQILHRLEKNTDDLSAATSAWKRSVKDGEEAKTLWDSLESLDKREKALTLKRNALATDLEEADREQSRLQAVVDERKTGIPEGFTTLDALEKEIAGLELALAHGKKDRELAETQYVECLRLREAARESLDGAARILEKTRELCETMNAEFAKRLGEAGFTGMEPYRAAMNDIPRIPAMEKDIRDYREARRAAEDRKTRSEEACAGLSEPDVPACAEALSRLTAQVEKTAEEKTRLETHLQRKKSVLDALKQLADKSARVEADYAVTGRLADVATGRNADGMTFQRYVLSALLDDVLYAAGRHLKSMSRNRFGLERAMERSDMRSAGGLDLLVSDAHTGTTRPVATLSGGESFLASLSLALGLADVVQAYAGGIKLDTIFVDEGFGTLDPETLDLAFRAFSDLQVRGRLVGIISHVPELKERIPTRLDIVPGKRGSRARFVL